MFGQDRTITVDVVHGPVDENQSDSSANNNTKIDIVVQNEKLHASGFFSNVYKALMVSPAKQAIAIKKIWRHKTSPEVAQREIKLLTIVDHQCVVKLLYKFVINCDGEKCDCLVLDFLPTDLLKLRQSVPSRSFDPLDAKLYAFQMFAGVDHINYHGITHCDLKPSNMIVDPRYGLLKIADFGNARIIAKNEKVEPYQVTRYYRAPELVFQCFTFTASVDRWACGCVLAELIMGKPLLNGRDKDDQARIIIELLGYPSMEQIQAMKVSRPRFGRKAARGVEKMVAGYNFPPEALEIVRALLVYEPKQRMLLQNVLAHKYFDELRQFPPPKRADGHKLPPLNFWAVEQSTQPSERNK